APGDGVVDPVERDADPLARRQRRPAEQIVAAQMRKPAAVAPGRCSHGPGDNGVSHAMVLLPGETTAISLDSRAALGHAITNRATASSHPANAEISRTATDRAIWRVGGLFVSGPLRYVITPTFGEAGEISSESRPRWPSQFCCAI